eukprot:6429205-Prymnesium_polylepis.1
MLSYCGTTRYPNMARRATLIWGAHLWAEADVLISLEALVVHGEPTDACLTRRRCDLFTGRRGGLP